METFIFEPFQCPSKHSTLVTVIMYSRIILWKRIILHRKQFQFRYRSADISTRNESEPSSVTGNSMFFKIILWSHIFCLKVARIIDSFKNIMFYFFCAEKKQVGTIGRYENTFWIFNFSLLEILHKYEPKIDVTLAVHPGWFAEKSRTDVRKILLPHKSP